MSASSVVAGIDVAKAHVDVSVLGAKLDAQRFDNQAEGHSALTAALKPLDVALVVMEATGGYETELACALQAAGSGGGSQPSPGTRLRQVDGPAGQDRHGGRTHAG